MVKQSLLLFIFLLSTAHIMHAMEAMDIEPTTQRKPRFSLYQCATCNQPCIQLCKCKKGLAYRSKKSPTYKQHEDNCQESRQRCECTGVYYCDEACKDLGCKLHQNDCETIKSAFSGNVEMMKAIFDAHMQVVSATSADNTPLDSSIIHTAQSLRKKSRHRATNWMFRHMMLNEYTTGKTENLCNEYCNELENLYAVEQLTTYIDCFSKHAANWIQKHIPDITLNDLKKAEHEIHYLMVYKHMEYIEAAEESAKGYIAQRQNTTLDEPEN